MLGQIQQAEGIVAEVDDRQDFEFGDSPREWLRDALQARFVAEVQAAARTEELRRLIAQRDRMKMRGEDTSQIGASILSLRRLVRDGPNAAAGLRLGERYLLIEQLGHGGFASVWKAWDEQRGQPVALKLLHAQWANDRSRVERVERGARRMVELRHPNLVPVLDGPSVDGHHHFFVMPYYVGGDLGRAMTRAKLDMRAAQQALADALEGLVHVHTAGCVHRDVKPANVLLDEHGHGYLSDFDLLHAFDTTAGTRTGAGMGTFVYAAPEQLMDAASVDARADVYAAGMCALFVQLGKEPPALVERTEPQVIDELVCSDELREAIRAAVSYARDERPAGCEALLAALRGSSVNSRRKSVRPRRGGDGHRSKRGCLRAKSWRWHW